MYRVFFYLTLSVVITTEVHVALGETPESFKRPVTLEECSVGGVGPPGPPGQRGNRGPEGLPVSTGKNWRQCSWNTLNDGQDSGQVLSCDFTKEYDDTSIYVSVSSNMRVAYTDGACCRWYYKFNGNECSTPATIELITYGAGYGVSYNLHRPRILVGYCDSLSAGALTVTFWVGNCQGYGTFDCYTGWNSATHFIIEEVTASTY